MYVCMYYVSMYYCMVDIKENYKFDLGVKVLKEINKFFGICVL